MAGASWEMTRRQSRRVILKRGLRRCGNSLPRRRRGTRIGGNESYKHPGAPQTLQDLGYVFKKPMFYNLIFTETENLIICARNSIPGVWRSLIWVVFHVESVFEVESTHILPLEAKMEKNLICLSVKTSIS